MIDETVSADEATRNFPRILTNVEAGRSYLVTAEGAAIARIVPVSRRRGAASVAKEALLARLRSQPVQVVGHRWSRDDLYER
jgi:antitoxin (DNA-binding transcriptional repressor) of toxin-antitoxin stability system